LVAKQEASSNLDLNSQQRQTLWSNPSGCNFKSWNCEEQTPNPKGFVAI